MTTQLDYLPSDLESWPPAEATRKCPFAFYDKLRELSPVYRYPEPHPLTGAPVFFVSSWEAASYVLNHPDEFESEVTTNLPEMAMHAELPFPETPTNYRPENVAFTTREDHEVKRAWTDRLFTRERLDSYAPVVREVADRLIDGFIDNGTVDISREFAEPLTLEVLTTIMGVPVADSARIKAWSDASTSIGFNPHPAPEDVEAARLANAEIADYVAAQCLERVEAPRDDYLSEIVQAQIARDGAFDKNAMTVHFRTVYRVAYHTSASVLASVAHQLAINPDDQATLRSDPAKLRRIIEEIIRIEAPLQFGARIAIHDTTVAGVDIPAGAIVWASFGAANHDPAKFPDPQTLDINRRNVAHHLGFGTGEHRCPGAPLARLYAQIGYERLLARTSRFVLDDAGTDMTPRPSFTFRVPTRVVLRFDKAEAPSVPAE